MKIRKIALLAFVLGVVTPLSSCIFKDPEPSTKDDDQGGGSDTHIHTFVATYDEKGHWLECECGEIKDKVDHSLNLTSTVPATCLDGEKTTYKCDYCDYQITQQASSGKGHNIVSSILKEATCQEDGIKVYSCTDCDYKYQETYKDLSAHKYDEGVKKDNITTYSCIHEGCDHSYEVVSFKEEVTATIDSSVLSSVGAVELKEATIKFDEQTLSSLENDITITAEKVEASVVNEVASNETKELLKDAPIYEFSLTDGEEDVHVFSGEIEISLPYELKENEDPNTISILYIDENGKTQNIQAHYSNGTVSFKTIHFSIYAVVQMKREQMCDAFGHNLRYLKETESTCVEHGHVFETCIRCGSIVKTEKELKDHNYQISASVPSTTTEQGYITYECSECHHSYNNYLPVLPKEGTSFYVNLLKSISGSNFKVSIDQKNNGVEKNALQDYICINTEDPFQLEIRNNESFSVIDETHHYAYGNDEVSCYESDAIVETKAILDTISTASETFETVIDFVFEVVEKILLTKEEKEDEIVIKIDMDKVKAFMDDLKTLTIEEMISKYVGTTFLNDVLEFIEDSFDRSLEATFAALSDIGIDVESVFTLISAFSGFQAEYDEIFTEDVLKENTYDYICELTRSDIPSFKNIESLVNEYKDLTLYGIVSSVSEDMDQTEDEFWAETMDGFDEFKDIFKCELVTTKAGQFKSVSLVYPTVGSIFETGPYYASANASQYFHYAYSYSDENGSVGEAKITITTDFDVKAAQMKAEEAKTKIKAIYDAFDFTNKENAKEMLYKVYGLRFSVIDTSENEFFDSEHYTAYISEPTTAFNDLYRPKHQVEVDGEDHSDEELNIKGQILVVLRNSCEQSVNSLNSLLGEEKTWGKCVSNLFQRVQLGFIDENSGDENFIDYIDLREPTGSFILNEVSGKSSYIGLNENSHNFVFNQINYIEFHAKFPHIQIDKEDINKLVFYKASCIYCDEEEFYVYEKGESTFWNRDGGIIFSEYMNEEARKYVIALFEDVHNSKSEWALEISSPIIDEETFRRYFDYARKEHKDLTLNLGNVTITIKYTLSSECSNAYNETITIDIDNKEKTTVVNYLHDDPWDDVGKFDYILLDTVTYDCCKHEHYGYFCNDCGALIREEYNTQYSHEMQTTTIVEPTLTLRGVEVETCIKCGETHYHFISPHTHSISFNYTTNAYYCNVCGKVFQDTDMIDYAIEKVEYNVYEHYDDETPSSDYFFSVKNLVDGYWRDDYNDVLSIAWVFLNEDGSYEIDPEYTLSKSLANDGDCYIEIGNEIFSEKMYQSYVFKFDKEEYDQMAEKAEAEGRVPVFQVIIPEHIHSYSDAYSFNEIAHWHDTTCFHDIKGDYEEHKFDENGVCTVCGYELHVEEKMTYEKSFAHLEDIVKQMNNDDGYNFGDYDEELEAFCVYYLYDETELDPEDTEFLGEVIAAEFYYYLSNYSFTVNYIEELVDEDDGTPYYELYATSDDEYELGLLLQSWYGEVPDEETGETKLSVIYGIFVFTEIEA